MKSRHTCMVWLLRSGVSILCWLILIVFSCYYGGNGVGKITILCADKCFFLCLMSVFVAWFLLSSMILSKMLCLCVGWLVEIQGS